MPDGGGRGRRHEGQAQRVQAENFPERPGVKVIKKFLFFLSFRCSTLEEAPGLTHKYKIRTKRFAKNNALSYLPGGEEKKCFSTLSTSANAKKTFFLRQCCSGQIISNVCAW
jgi:hypothetical protein